MTETEFPQDVKKISLISAFVVVLLVAAVIASYRYAKSRSETIVLPGGVTYLGPLPTVAAQPVIPIPIPSDATWSTYKGKLFPYSFSYPTTLALGVFPNDPFDGVTIFWGNTNPQENLFLRVEDLNKLPNQAGYISKSKKEYVENWWKQYNYQGASSVTQFTNGSGLVGYRAKYTDANGAVVETQTFFEVPGRPELVIWMSRRLLSQAVFDRLVDSLAWNK